MRTAQTGNIFLKLSLFFLLIAGPILSLNSISFKIFPSVAWSEDVEDVTANEVSGPELKDLEKAEKKSQKKLREMNAPILPSTGESAEERLRRREEAKERLEYFKKDVEKKREALAGSGTPSVTSNKLEAIPAAVSVTTGNDPEAIQKEVKRRAALLAEKERLERELQKSETKEERKAREAREKTLRAQEEKERRVVEARKKAELAQAKAEEKRKKDAVAAQVKAQQEKLKLEEARRKAETKRLADLAEVKRNENAKKQAELERTRRAQEKKDREMADAKRKEELARQKTLEKKKQQEAVAKQKAEEERKKVEAKKSAETARQERIAKEAKAKEEARKQEDAERVRRAEEKKSREDALTKKREERAKQDLEDQQRREAEKKRKLEAVRQKEALLKQDLAQKQKREAEKKQKKGEADKRKAQEQAKKAEDKRLATLAKDRQAEEVRKRKVEEARKREETKKQEALKKSRQPEEKKTTLAVSNDEARRKVINNYLKQSQDLLDKGLYGPARVRLERVLKLDPDNVIAKNLMGLAVEGEFVAGQARLKNEQQIAREIEEDTMRQKFLDTMSRIDREIQQQTDEGNAFYQKEDLVEANIHYRRVMALQAERQTITEGLIEKLKARQTESLNDSAFSAAQTKQAKTELLMKDARRLETDREWDKAAELYESVLALDPLNSEASRGIDHMKKQFLAEQKKKDNAGGKKLEADLKGKVDFYVGQAEEAKNAGELDVAKVFAEQALTLDQGNRKARGILELIEKGK